MLALLLSTAPAGAVSAEQGSFQPSARVLQPNRDFQERIDIPGERDWYSISGPGLLKKSEIIVGGEIPDSDDELVIEPPAICAGRKPLLVRLYNSEGRFMRSARAPAGDETAGHARLKGPELPGRYVVEVRAVDPGCAGLPYTISAQKDMKVTPPSGGSSEFYTARVKCQHRHDVRVRAEADVAKQRRRVRKTRGRQRARHRRILRQYKRELKRARAEERRACRRIA